MIIFFHLGYILIRMIKNKLNLKSENALSISENDLEDIRFYPPLYCQRYSRIKEILQQQNVKKVVEFGCAELKFFKYLKSTDGIEEIFEVDIDKDLLNVYKNSIGPYPTDFLRKRLDPLTVQVFAGSISERDERLLDCDAVVCIELIEHLYPDILEEVPFTVFGFIKPKVAIFTTPNFEFNILFHDFKSKKNNFRHYDHKFEWTRGQFENWAENITDRYPNYKVTFHGIGPGPKGTEAVGCCTQMAIFLKIDSLIDDTNSPNDGEIYELLSKIEYPLYIEYRTKEEILYDQSVNYLHSCAFNYEDDISLTIPLTQVYTFVQDSCESIQQLREVLEKFNWGICENDSGDICVKYPFFTESDTEFSDWTNENEPNTTINLKDVPVENWDSTSNNSWRSEDLGKSVDINDSSYEPDIDPLSVEEDWERPEPLMIAAELPPQLPLANMMIAEHHAPDENGDVANNNRDGEGNNALPAPAIPVQFVEPHADILPLLDDLDNDNPPLVPFPPWLLNLLDLAVQGEVIPMNLINRDIDIDDSDGSSDDEDQIMDLNANDDDLSLREDCSGSATDLSQ